jgi:hypothetical protein
MEQISLQTVYCSSLWMDNISSMLVKYWLRRHSKEETLLKKSIENGSTRGRLGLWCTTCLIFLLVPLFKSMNYISNKSLYNCVGGSDETSCDLRGARLTEY